MTNVHTLKGPGSTQDRAGEMAAAIRDLIYERGVGMSLAAIIGVLEIVKHELLQEQQ